MVLGNSRARPDLTYRSARSRPVEHRACTAALPLHPSTQHARVSVLHRDIAALPLFHVAGTPSALGGAILPSSSGHEQSLDLMGVTNVVAYRCESGV